MHDFVRDVAIFIASEKKLIACDSKTNYCTWISPFIGERIELQAGLTIFPNLRLLWIDCSRDKELEIDSQFFERMKQLNMLSIRSSSLQQLPQTLVDLQTLVLESCGSLESISFVGELVNLEILICRGSKSIENLPMEMRELRHLRLLEISNCQHFKTIEPGIISSLKGLEELIVEYHICIREVENEWVNELEQLSSLSWLKIKINDSSFATQQMTLPPNMVRYHIEIGRTWLFINKSLLYEKKMELALPSNINIGNCIVKYARSVEEMYLKGGDGSSLDFGVAHNIKILIFKECSTVKKLVRMKTAAIVFPVLEVLELERLSELEGICDVDGPIASDSLTNLKELRVDDLPALEHLNVVSNFNKLSTIYVRKCSKLKSLFSSSMMTRDSSLVQLKSLKIRDCDMMEQVFLWNNEENQIPLVFANLKSLQLKSLPKLTSFSKGIASIEFPVLEELEVNRCPLKNFSFTTSTEGDDAVLLFCEHEKVEIVEERHLESMVEESRKRFAGLSIGMKDEFQSGKQRRIGSEGGHDSFSPLEEMMSPDDDEDQNEEEEEEMMSPDDDKDQNEEAEEEMMSSDHQTVEEMSSKRPMEDEDRVCDDPESPSDYVVPERCIEHCRLFIPDCEFDKAKLVRMWIAEECFELGEGTTLEGVGSFYFDALVDKEIIVASKFDNLHKQMKYKFNSSQVLGGNIKRSKYVSINASKYDEKYNYGEALHLTWQCEKIDRTFFDALKRPWHLHTLVVHEDFSPSKSELPSDIFLGLELLKTLDLSGTHIEELPGSIGKLKSLRYLDVSETPIKRLPESLDCLVCLQTLNLNACIRLFSLPRGLGRLVNLRHLDLDVVNQLKSMPRGMGNLTKLQTLRGFIVEKNDGCSIRELKNMNDITGSFSILRLENVSNVEEAEEAALCDKKYIEKLELRWQNRGNEDTSEILESLKPNYNLKELRLINYGGSKLPRWMSNPSYADLVSITTCKCINCDIMPSVGELPSLKILCIVGMENMRYINTLFCRNHGTKTLKAFPRLEKLTLDSMPALEEWTGVEDGDFPCLAHISIRYCPKLRVLPSLSNLHSLERLEINDCSQLSSLPEGSLPESLESLTIKDCPELKERCFQDGGLDWSKISFVKCIWFDSEKISNNVQKTSFNRRMPRSYTSLPTPLKMLCGSLNGLDEGGGIPIALDDDVFGNKCEIYIHLDDFIPFCDLEPVTEKCMIVYIWNLYNKMKVENTLRRFQFVNLFAMSCAESGQSDVCIDVDG